MPTQNEQLADIRAELAKRPPTQGTFVDRRARWEPLYQKICPTIPGTVAEPVDIPGVRAEWVTTAQLRPRDDAVILYIHGGGFTAGTVGAYRGLASRYSAAAQARVLSFDYRHAPEQPFPAALDDSVAVYRWLLDQTPPHRIGLVGDSAGGNLVVATMLQIRDSGDRLPAAAVCVSPVFDLALTGESVKSRVSRDPMILPESLRLCSAAYLGGKDSRTPLASPLYADLHGLPPMLIEMGSEEMLRDDSVRLAEKAKQAGVDVSLEEWVDMIHVWHLFADRLEDGRAAIAGVGAFLRKHIP
jgi:monoterpene epsilon-lactone hydrolase